MNVRLTQIDGGLPNLALMKLAHWHRANGDSVTVTRHIEPSLFEPQYDRVYGSAIFAFSKDRIQRFKTEWPTALLGGTGSGNWQTVEEVIGGEYEEYDYSGYPDFTGSLGFTQRGCRLRCKFCVVPQKEGAIKHVSELDKIWRGAPFPKHIHLLDNDFFGQPQWRELLIHAKEHGFKLCFNQGINIRLINGEQAALLAQTGYWDDSFKKRQLYTAWDNIGDEKIFFKGVDLLEASGVPPKHLMVYMLIGYDPKETWERIWYRFKRMIDRDIKPYPMVFDRSRTDLLCFQRWVITRLYEFVSWDKYQRETKTQESVAAWQVVFGEADSRPLGKRISGTVL